MYLFKPLAIIILIVAFGINLDFQSLPTYAAFFWSFYGALPIVGLILNSVIVINNLTPSYQQIQNIINRSKDHYEESGEVELENSNFDIKIDNISFKYNGKNELFKNCSFKIFNNKINTIVGESGVGKSTLIDLIVSFQLPNTGDIFFGKECMINDYL